MASFFSDPTMSRRMSEGNGDLRRRSSAGVAREAYVTMVTTDDYVQGAMVLAHSLRETGNASGRDVVCMVTNNLSLLSIELLGKAGMKVVVVDPIGAPAPSGVSAWDNAGYTKLNLWGLDMYDRVLYIDADCLITGSMQELFDRDVSFAAAPDTFPPDRLNAGVMLVKPDRSILEDMKAKVDSLPSYDGGDTGFLNAFFPTWYQSDAAARLPFKYNALRTMHHMTRAKPGYWEAVGKVACLHFCSSPKPWDSPPKGPLEQQWWVALAKCQLELQLKGVKMPSLKERGEVQGRRSESSQAAAGAS